MYMHTAVSSSLSGFLSMNLVRGVENEGKGIVGGAQFGDMVIGCGKLCLWGVIFPPERNPDCGYLLWLPTPLLPGSMPLSTNVLRLVRSGNR